MATVERVSSEQRFALHGIPWQAYLSLRDLPENNHVRMTYNRGGGIPSFHGKAASGSELGLASFNARLTAPVSP
jgi:hypothetical protein